MRDRFFLGELRAALAVLLPLSTIGAQQEPARPPQPVRTATVELLDAHATTRLDLLRKTGQRPAKIVAEVLDLTANGKDAPRRVAVLQMVAELTMALGTDMTPGADQVAHRLIRILTDEKRPKLKLGKAIRNAEDRVEYRAAVALGALAPYLDAARQATTDALEKELRERSGFHIANVLRAYYRSLIHVAAAPEDLIGLLSHDVSYVRETAAEALGWRGPAARTALGPLAEALEAEHPKKIQLKLNGFGGGSSREWTKNVQNAAARALVRIAPADKLTRPAHLRIVRTEKDPRVLLTSLRYVGTLGAEAESALPRLCKLVHHTDPRLAAEAVTAIGMIGIPSDAVLTALQKASLRKEKGVAVRAAATLRVLRGRGGA